MFGLLWWVLFGRFVVHIVCIVCIVCIVYIVYIVYIVCTVCIVCLVCIVCILTWLWHQFQKAVSQSVSESVTDMRRLWSDLGPIKIHEKILDRNFWWNVCKHLCEWLGKSLADLDVILKVVAGDDLEIYFYFYWVLCNWKCLLLARLTKTTPLPKKRIKRWKRKG